MADSKCPCGSKKVFQDCCEPIVKGKLHAPTAESLMRARYTAYVKSDFPFLLESLHPSERADYDEDAVKKWASEAQWDGLEILRADAGGESDSEGRVEFQAKYTIEDKPLVHHETAEFKKDNGQWYFVEGRVRGVDPIRRDGPKVGRNDPCPCGSGKKFKKCCA